MTAFGEGLRRLRRESHDPKNGKGLSQKRFGELLKDECGRYFSGAAVHYWESGESEIHKDDRDLLIALLKVLYKTGGLKSISQAANLLRAGNFRALNKIEKQQIFPKDLLEASTSFMKMEVQEQEVDEEELIAESSAGNTSSISDFQKLIDEAREGPAPAWPRISAGLMRNIGERVEAANPGRGLLWLLVWIFAANLITPSLQWPYSNQQSSINSLYLYIVGTLILPLFIGLLINTDQDPTWKEREEANPVIIRLYTYQGAFVGFHVGYFAIVMICLIGFYLQIKPATWFQFVLAGLPIFIGSMGAHVVPGNLWLAYERLSLLDGWIFFIFIPIGFVWAFFFLEYYSWLTSPILGAFIIITAMLLAIAVNKRIQKTSKV